MATHARPSFRGAALYNHPKQRFSFWYPSDWHILQFDDAAHQVAVTPQQDDISTSFMIEVRDLETPITRDDRSLLREGIEAGLKELTNYQLLNFEPFDEKHRFGFDFLYTFIVDHQVRKRHTVLYYRDHWQYSLSCQGATVEDYHYWLPMLNFILMTCTGATFNAVEWMAARDAQAESNR